MNLSLYLYVAIEGSHTLKVLGPSGVARSDGEKSLALD